MRKYTFCLVVLLTGILSAVLSCAQNGIISTVAGNHLASYGGDGGAATAASINHPNGLAFDAAGNMYIADYFSNRIRKVSATGIITTVVGDGTAGASGDGGPATAARVNGPIGLTVDASGCLYIADFANHRIRKINSSGIITTIAGTGSPSYGGDGGPATAAQLHFPSAIAFDVAGNMYIADFSNNRIRKVDPAGIISTFAGTGVAGYSGDGGSATAAKLNSAYGVTVNSSGDIYIADYNNNVIRKVSTGNIISTFAGNGVNGYSGDYGAATAAEFNLPEGIVFDNAGNSYINDVYNNRIRKINVSGIISTVAGNGIAGYTGNGGIGTAAEIHSPAVLAFDNNFNLYIADYENNVIRKVQNSPAYVSDSFLIFLSTDCSGPQITIVPNHYTSGMSVKTFYGDGQSNSSLISGSGILSINHSYPNSGTYTIKHVLFNGASAIDSFKYSYHFAVCNSFALQNYYDGNSNCIKDPTEAFLSQPVTIEVDSNGVAIDTISATSGLNYEAYGAVGTIYSFKVISAPAGFNVTCPVSGIVYDTISAGILSGPVKQLGLSCTGAPGFDLSVNVAIYTPATHDNGGNIYVQNNTCNPINGTMTLYYSPKYSGAPSDISPAATSVTGNTIVWDLTALNTTSGITHLYYILRAGSTLVPLGDTTHSDFTISPTSGDANPNNNETVIIDTVKGSWDPNEMRVTPSCIESPNAGDMLKYTISFENTGNDTAHNIYVLDTLPDNLDIASVRIIMSSNEMYTSHFKDGSGHNILKFDFPGINLLDSSHHGQCDGIVIFSVNLNPGATVSSSMSNSAGIYFDDNDVVMTNGAAVNPLPTAITGVASLCVGLTTALSDMGGGTWSSPGYGGIVSIGSGTGLVTGISAGTATISYTLGNGCATTLTATVSPLLPPIAGTTNVCAGLTTMLSNAAAGGIWSSSNTTIAAIAPSTGIVSGAGTGTVTITYTLSGSCITTSTITVNPVPAAITGISIVCTGLTATLSDITAGGTWSSGNTTIAVVGSGSGVITGIVAGTPTITYTLPPGCIALKTITVNPIPFVYSVTGGGSYCAGDTGVHIYLSGSAPSTNYQLYNGGVLADTALSGTGLSLDFGLYTAVGSYTVVATGAATACSNNMISSATVTINPLPLAIAGVPSVCTGSATTLSDGSAGGVWSSGNTILATIGTGSGIVNGIAAGTVSITYTLPTGCLTSASVVVNPLPSAISGTANVCVGSTILLSDTTIGGKWSSSNSVIATIGSTSGMVTGVTAGTSSITYTLITGCMATKKVTIDSLPSAIAGFTRVCVNATTALNDTTLGGAWSTENTTATITPGTGIVTGASAGTATITYALPDGCIITKDITVNPLPVAGTVTGPSSICQDSAITLIDSVSAGVWTSNGSSATVTSAGVVTGITIGNDTIIYSVTNVCGTDNALWPVKIIKCDFTKVSSVTSSLATIQVYPNPNDGSFNLLLSSAADEPGVIIITNIVGQKVMELPMVANRVLPVIMKSQQPPGIYLITVVTDKGKYVAKVTINP